MKQAINGEEESQVNTEDLMVESRYKVLTIK